MMMMKKLGVSLIQKQSQRLITRSLFATSNQRSYQQQQHHQQQQQQQQRYKSAVLSEQIIDYPNPSAAAVDENNVSLPFSVERGSSTPAIDAYFANREHEHPIVVVDSTVVEWGYHSLASALPDTDIYYAVKANPAEGILILLNQLGCNFDVASRQEIELCLSVGICASKLSFGNTIKKEKDIAYAHSVGVNYFAFDAQEELEKIARSAPGSDVFVRILTSNEGAEWPLSKKFGCETDMAGDLLINASTLGLTPRGVSFHVGSQQTDPSQWDEALYETKLLFDRLSDHGVEMDLINLGGGFPSRYRELVPGYATYGAAINAAIKKNFGDHKKIKTIAEPGRGLVGDAGVIRTEVVLISKKETDTEERWVYLDIGKFSGLAETMDESIKYRLVTPYCNDDDVKTGPVIISGPSCDSADILYEQSGYELPLDLKVGDIVYILATGAYTSTYSSIGFNGFPPLETVVLPESLTAETFGKIV